MTVSTRTFHCMQRGEVNQEICSLCWLKMSAIFREINGIMARSRWECKAENVLEAGAGVGEINKEKT
jgi:hypothetical protein